MATEQPQDTHSAGREAEEVEERTRDTMRELEAGDVPADIADWPSGPAKFKTYGSDDEPYGVGLTAKLGPSLRRHADGSISIDGKKVDNPEDYKGTPIPGGPTDPNAPKLAREGGSR
jgi:hypothetical protein